MGIRAINYRIAHGNHVARDEDLGNPAKVVRLAPNLLECIITKHLI